MKKRSTKTGGPIRPIAAEPGPALPSVPPDPDPDPVPSKNNPPAATSGNSGERVAQIDNGEPLLPLVQVARSSAAPPPASRLPLSHAMLAKRAAAAKASTSISSEIPPVTVPSSESDTIHDVKPATTELPSPKVSVRHSIPKPPVSSASSPTSTSSAPPSSKTSLSGRPAVGQSGGTVPMSSTRVSGFRLASVRQASSAPSSPSPLSASRLKQKTEAARNAIPRSSGITPPSSPTRPTSVIPRSQPTSSASIRASSSPAKRAPTTAPARNPLAPSRATLASVGLVVKALSAAARDGSDLFLPLKDALVGVVELEYIFHNSVEVATMFAKLRSRILAFNVIVETRQAELSEMKRSLNTYISSIAQAVQALWQAYDQEHARGGFVGEASASIGSQRALPERDMNDHLSLVKRITSLLEIFEMNDNVAINHRLATILSRIPLPQQQQNNNKGPGNASTASLTQSIVSHTGNTTYNFGRDVLNNNYVNNNVFTQKQEAAMKTIKSILGDNFLSEAADFEQPSYAGCMEGTRTSILSKFIKWVTDDPMVIFWLAGMAGTGKTSIAVTLCRMLRKNTGVLFGGGYFCSRSAGSIARTDVRRILPTLAVNLAGLSEEFAEELAAELEKDRNLGHKPVVDQIGPLLRRPLERMVSSSRTVVFLIDALDECRDELELAELLTIIANTQFDGKVKFILTSRPELHIRGTPISNPEHNTILQLHTIGVEEVMSDIQLYITGTLNNIAPHASWYTDDDIDLLVKLSAGLFIFASTVLKYVLYRTGDEDRRRRLHRATTATRTAGTSSIDQIYELILVDASHSDMIETDELEMMMNILACILSARASLSVEALASLIRVSPGELRGSLERLHSLVHLPDDDTLPGVRTLHASLGDYLFERAPQHMRIAATLGHDLLARGSLLRLAKDDLCFNISQCRSSFEPTRKDISNDIPPSLAYACLHWTHHIVSASSGSAFDEDVGRVFRAKFLFWLEVMCILGKVGLASVLLRIAGSAVKEPTISQFLRDANTFVVSSCTTISRSIPHIYISALPFAAKDSLVYRDFVPLCTGLVSVTTFGIDRHGGRLVATLVGHEGTVNSVSYSRDDRLLASGSDDGTVRIWDTLTGGEHISPLRSSGKRIYSVAFAPSGHRVASGGQDEVMHVWSLTTGQLALPPMRHNAAVLSVTFSPDGTLIASGCCAYSVSLWCSKTGQSMHVLHYASSPVDAVVFSPNGRLVAFASWDATIRFWDAGTGDAVGIPPISFPSVECMAFSPDGKRLAVGGHLGEGGTTIWHIEKPDSNRGKIFIPSFKVKSLTFSPDGSRLFSAGDQQIIRCWDSHIGQEIPGLSLAGHESSVRSITLSQDGRFLASGSADYTVRIWDTVDRVEVASQPIQAYSSSFSWVQVSQDGTSIISSSQDCTVRIWDARNGAERVPQLKGHSGKIYSMAISSNGCLIASSSLDRTVRLWDAQTGVPVGDPLRGHSQSVLAVAFSPDALWLASGSADGGLRVWDVTTGATLFNLVHPGVRIEKLAFSPDGRLLAALGSDDRVHLWLSGTDQRAREPIHVGLVVVRAIFFSPDSTRIGACGAESKVWDIESGHKVFSLGADIIFVIAAAYSPDGRYIAGYSFDEMVRIWDANNGATVSILPSRVQGAGSLAFTADGISIVFIGDKCAIHTWNVEAALSLPSQREHNPTARLACATFDENGWLVGSNDELLLWVPPEYRHDIQLSPCSMTVGSRRVVLSADEGIHWGEQWTSCWRNAPLGERFSL